MLVEMSVEQLSLFGPDPVPIAPDRCDYFVLISPPPAIIRQIAAMKKTLHKTVPIGDQNLHSIAHISLFRMLVPENDDLVLQKVRHALAHLYCFTITFNGAELFVHGSTKKSLVIKIENPEPIRMIHAFITREFRTPKKITPHLTIARNIPVRYADKINPEDFYFYGEFLCDRITILKKGSENTKFEIPLRQY